MNDARGELLQSTVRVTLPAGREILMPALEDASASGEVVRDVRHRPFQFSELIQVATEIGSELAKTVRAVAPDRAEVEISLGFDAKSGLIVAALADIGTNAAVKLTFEWQRAPAEA